MIWRQRQDVPISQPIIIRNQSFRTVQTIPFDNSYSRLPARFFTRLAPTPVADPQSIRVNRELAGLLGIDPDWLASPAGTAVVAGNELPEGADPIATVYAGHQFGS